MRELIQSIFGVYTPLTDENNAVLSGIAGVDWEYILGAVLFCIILISFFRIIGVVIKK